MRGSSILRAEIIDESLAHLLHKNDDIWERMISGSIKILLDFARDGVCILPVAEALSLNAAEHSETLTYSAFIQT
jgi:hypothetical protein